MSWYSYGYYPPAPTQAELKAKAAKAVKPGYKPITVDGRVIATTWWGRKWCENIDRYADNYNRLDRGRKYVRANAVIDLDIDGGTIRAKVIGSARKPYEITVKIAPLNSDNYEHILSVCQGKLESLSALESGKFPKEYQELFTAEGKGLFPTLKEISFSCSCPDSSRLCKHIAAVLYAVGRRLDDNPLIFLSLRGIDVEEFSTALIRKEAVRLWQNSEKEIDKSRLLGEEEAVRLFGFEPSPDLEGKELDFRKALAIKSKGRKKNG